MISSIIKKAGTSSVQVLNELETQRAAIALARELDSHSDNARAEIVAGITHHIRHPPHRDQGSLSAVTAGDDEHSAAALPLRSQRGFGDLVRSSQSYGTGA